MFNWIDPQAHEQRLQDLRRDAEQWRLIRELEAARPRPRRFYRPALAGLGRRLVTWGSRLRAHDGPMVEVSRG